MKRIVVLLTLLFLPFFLASFAFSKGTPALTSLINKADVYAFNYLITNHAYTNVFSAEIYGIIDIISTNTNVTKMPGQTYTFWSSLSNTSNLDETNIVLMLTNYQTNAGIRTGDWTISVLDISNSIEKILFTSSSYLLPVFTNLKPSLPIHPDEKLNYGIRMTVASNADVNSWASINIIVRTLTNARRYLGYDEFGVQTVWYGGSPSVTNRAKIVVTSSNPIVTLTKTIELITNLALGDNSIIPGSDIHYLIHFTNIGSGTGKNLRIRDILPSRHVILSNGFVTNGFASTFSVEFSDNNGSSFIYAPTTWDTNVDQILFRSTNTFAPGSSGTIRYKVRIR